MNNKVFIIEDHDEALRVWKEKKIKNLDLVHIDAHMDFGVHLARPIEQVVNKARSLKELKRGLEYSLAFGVMKMILLSRQISEIIFTQQWKKVSLRIFTGLFREEQKNLGNHLNL